MRLVGTLSGEPTLRGGLSGAQSLGGSLSFGSSGVELRPATTTDLGGIIVGDDLTITEQGVLSVLKANEVDEDNTHPITAAAVYTEVGNINALLSTI